MSVGLLSLCEWLPHASHVDASPCSPKSQVHFAAEFNAIQTSLPLYCCVASTCCWWLGNNATGNPSRHLRLQVINESFSQHTDKQAQQKR